MKLRLGAALAPPTGSSVVPPKFLPSAPVVSEEVEIMQVSSQEVIVLLNIRITNKFTNEICIG